MQHSKAKWPCLETLDPGRSHLNVANLEVLGQCQWLMLKTLMLSGKALSW